ncbi:MAG: homoserine kinase [Candidatus Parcubacteria bacterium]|nr:homoserine kinase [Candidatus Parcubacteria bacterium]
MSKITFPKKIAKSTIIAYFNMTKKTILNKISISEILNNYSIGEIDSFHLIKNGLMHSNYFLQTVGGKFILRIFESRSDEQAMLEAKILNKLKISFVPVPQIISTKSGKLFSNYGEKRVAIFSFLLGEHILEKDITLAQIKSVGANMGQLHSLLKNFKPKEIFSKEDYDIDYIRKLLSEIKKENPDFPWKIEAYVLNILNAAIITALPRGINHGDMFDDNVLFIGNKVSGVLDFDDCYFGNFLGDLGCGLTYWCIDDEIDYQKCQCFVKAYESARRLSFGERKYLYEQTQLIALVHVVHLLMDKKNWNKITRPMKVINLLNNTTKEEFLRSIFS